MTDITETVQSAQSTFRPSLSLRANFRWTFVGNIINAASQWGMLVVIAKMTTSTELGRFALGLAIAAPITAIVLLQLQIVLVTDVTREYRFGHYLGARLVLTLFGFLAIAAIACFGHYERDTVWVILLVGLAKAAEWTSELVRGLFQRAERMDISSISLMIKGPTSLAILALLIWITGSIKIGLLGVAITNIGILAIYDLPNGFRLLSERLPLNQVWGEILPCFDFSVLIRLIRKVIPLGVGVFLFTLQSNVPRYFLEHYHGASVLGYFSAMAYISAIGAMIVAAMGQSASPRLARHYSEDPQAFRRLVNRLLGLGVLLGLAFVGGAAAFGKPVLTIIYSQEYASYHFDFIVISLAGAISFVASFCGFALVAARSFKFQLIAGVTSTLTAIVLASILVPLKGMFGAAITLFCGSFITCVLYYTWLYLIIRKRQLSR